LPHFQRRNDIENCPPVLKYQTYYQKLLALAISLIAFSQSVSEKKTYIKYYAMAKGSAILKFLKPVLTLSKWTLTSPVSLEAPYSIVFSRFNQLIGQCTSICIVVSNVYVAYIKFFSQINVNKVSSVTTLIGDLFLVASNISIYLYISNYESMAQTINSILTFESKLKLHSFNSFEVYRSYLIVIQKFYVFLNIKEHFYLGDFQFF
jgi:hypothetical protein